MRSVNNATLIEELIRYVVDYRRVSMSVRLMIFLCMLFSFNSDGLAQTNAARPDRGINPGGSYSVSDIENINMTNGNVNISIPLASLPPVAGSKLGFTVRAVYNSKLWDVVRNQIQPDPLNPASAYQTNQLQTADSNGGWTIGAAYRVDFIDSRDDFNWPAPLSAQVDPEYDFLISHRFVKCLLTTPDGAQHELRPLDFSPYPDVLGHHTNLRGYYTDYPGNKSTSLRYYSFDGSYLWVVIDPMSPAGGLTPTSWVIYLPDGTTASNNNGLQKIKDTNGNIIKIFTTENINDDDFTTHYQDDQTGREIQYVYTQFHDSPPSFQLKYQITGGGWATIDVLFRPVSVTGWPYLIGDAVCPDAALLADMTFSTLASIVLPQTEQGQTRRQFTFSYNADDTIGVGFTWRQDCSSPPITLAGSTKGLGSLSGFTMPGGATVDYIYANDLDTSSPPVGPLQDANDAARDRIAKKTLTHDGVTDVWNYSIGSNSITSSVTGPDGAVTTDTFYAHDPSVARYYGGVEATLQGKGGLVYRTNHSGKIIVERHWIHNSFGSSAGGSAQATGAAQSAPFNPVVDFEYTTLTNAQGTPSKISTKAMQYDFNGNLKSVTEYDFVDLSQVTIARDPQGIPIGVPTGSVALRTTTNTYYNPADTGNSANTYAKRALASATPLILNAIQESITGPARSQFSYDSQAYGTAPIAGNLTRESHWDGGKFLDTIHTYDARGNRTKLTDPLGNDTLFEYDSSTHAQVTRITVDPNPNVQGDEHVTNIVYDFWTGLVISSTDPNGKITTTNYLNQLLNNQDPFGRPGVVTDVMGRKTVTKYFDSARQVEVLSDLRAVNDGKIRSRVTADQLGRQIKHETSEDGNTYPIFSESVYRQMGRITFISNPKRSVAADTDGWTRTTRDDLGRVIDVTTFPGASIPTDAGVTGSTGSLTTSYDANKTSAIDQAGKARSSAVDGLGRLARVTEDPNGSALDISYSYDPLGNLTFVSQGVQQRQFIYDPLSRLTSAKNPEQVNQSGSMVATTYLYDDDSNLRTKTNPNGSSITFTYDGVNRLSTKSLSGGPVFTFTYDAPGFKGRLTSVTQIGGDGYYYDAYDNAGRVTSCRQKTTVSGTQYTYPMSYTYDLTGNLRSETYPSGRIVESEYDDVGRLAGVKKGGTSNYYAGAAPTDANRIGYTAHGAMSTIRLGNGKWEHTLFNSRLQPSVASLKCLYSRTVK